MWIHNDHGWALNFTAATDRDRINSIQYWAIPYDVRDVIPADAEIGYDPTTQLEDANALAFGETQFWKTNSHITLGQPYAGDWVYLAVVEFT